MNPAIADPDDIRHIDARCGETIHPTPVQQSSIATMKDENEGVGDAIMRRGDGDISRMGWESSYPKGGLCFALASAAASVLPHLLFLVACDGQFSMLFLEIKLSFFNVFIHCYSATILVSL